MSSFHSHESPRDVRCLHTEEPTKPQEPDVCKSSSEQLASEACSGAQCKAYTGYLSICMYVCTSTENVDRHTHIQINKLINKLVNNELSNSLIYT